MPRHGIDLGGHDPRPGPPLGQHDGDGAGSGAQVGGHALRGKPQRRLAGQGLALPPRDVDAGPDQHGRPAERHGADQPCQRLAGTPASYQRRQAVLVTTGRRHEIGGFLLGGDASGRSEHQSDRSRCAVGSVRVRSAGRPSRARPRPSLRRRRRAGSRPCRRWRQPGRGRRRSGPATARR